MKKALIILSIGILAQSLLAANTLAAHKKPKKVKHYIKHDYKEEALNLAPAKVAIQKTKPFRFMDGFSGNMALTTNYLFRGISQTSNLPATQGGITYTLPVGIYFNLWGSNVKFSNSPATVEIDAIAGIHRTWGENFTYDLNYARYNYPAAPLSPYNEFNTLFNYQFIQIGISYSTNVYNSHTPGTYYSGGINYEIPSNSLVDNVNIIALIGHYSLNRKAGIPYTDYSVIINKKLNETYTITGEWATTNGNAKNPPYDRDHLLAAITANF